MLYYLRKHQFSILLVAVIASAALMFFWDPNYRNQARQGMSAGESWNVLGHVYRSDELKEIEETHGMLASLAAREGDFTGRGPLMQHLNAMNSLSATSQRSGVFERQVSDDFIMNTAILREQCRALGISASDAECDERIKTLRQFQTETGQFDPSKWESFIDAVGGKAGAKRKQIYQALGDTVMLDKLVALVGQDPAPSKVVLDWTYAAENQKVTASVINFPRKNYETQAVTDDEIKKYYDEHKDGPELKSDEKRSLTYVLIPKPKPEELKDLSDEQKADKDKEYKRTAKKFADALVADDRGDKKFADVAAEMKLEVKTTAPFAQSAPPEELKDEAAVVKAAFEMTKDERGQPKEGTKGYYTCEIASLEEPQAMTLDQAKEKVTKVLKDQKQTQQLNEAVAAAKEKLKAALSAGKTIAEAAKDASVEAKELPVLTRRKLNQGDPNSQRVFEIAGALNAGELSDPVPSDDGEMFVFVSRKELPKDPKMEDQKKMLERRLANGLGKQRSNPFMMPSAAERSDLFVAWFSDLKKRAVDGKNRR